MGTKLETKKASLSNHVGGTLKYIFGGSGELSLLGLASRYNQTSIPTRVSLQCFMDDYNCTSAFDATRSFVTSVESLVYPSQFLMVHPL